MGRFSQVANGRTSTADVRTSLRAQDRGMTENAAPAKPSSGGGLAVTLLCDVVSPVAGYYVLRALGVSETWSLILSGLPPAAKVLVTLLRRRKIDGMGVFVLFIVGLSLVTAVLSGDPRTLLVRGGWVSLLIAAWMFGSLVFTRRPTTYQATIALLPGRADALEHFWETRPSFRRVWRVLAVVWGCGTLVGCALNILMAYTLPVDSVPALDTGLQIGSFVVLQVITQILLHREGTMREVWVTTSPR
jgi:hypothetical protein